MSIESNIDWLYSRQRERAAAQSLPSTSAPPAENKPEPAAATALKIINDYKRGRAIAEGVKLQLLKDIGEQPAEYLILLLCEALDRISGGGDSYFVEVEAAMKSKGIPSERMRADRSLQA